ncbi:MAG: DNA translocase FtsK 4TM domain-containing protein, partial [Arcobacteraceae bacterium]|nr:DNA translocase FtsK 4TM domain-containing protein [Arcobacteraceae bacterium]
MVGVVGYNVALFSHEYFGYLSYIYLFGLIYTLYKLIMIQKPSEEFWIKFAIGVFVFINLLLLQGLILDDELSGKIGESLIELLSPTIGIAGLWIFVLIALLVGTYMLLHYNDFDFEQFYDDLIALLKPKPKAKVAPKEKLQPQPKVKAKEIKVDDAAAKIRQIEEKIAHLDKQKANGEESVEVQNNSETEMGHEIEVSLQKEKVTIVEELEENKKLLEDIDMGSVAKPKDFKLPPADFFAKPTKTKIKINEAAIDKKIEDLLQKLMQFKIEGDVVRTYTGPIVTTFEFKPAPNVKVSKILGLQDDLAMALKAQTIRIQAPIPGKDVVGIEVPNENMETIYLRELLESEIFKNSKSPLTMILGKDIVGQPFITDLKKLPHLLIAGTTGSGKSVGINAMILSLLYKNSPDNLKLIMIDPKMLEFSIYNDIPHLLTPVITRPTEAINALANMVKEMERRYSMMAKTRTKNIENYNDKAAEENFEPFPYIVIIIDELADLMMTSGKEVEINIARLAQMARASGIHLVVATQRPSVDVVTGLIKANLPSRISYKVGQRVDSKIILDSMGAESLLGRGDMLFTPPGMSGLVRIHAPWSDEKEIEKVVEFLKVQREVQYDISFLKEKNDDFTLSNSQSLGELDELFEEAKLIVI